MAGQWRIRHKLMLGLCLVAVVMAVLLAGTAHGLTSYRRSCGMMESNVAELKVAAEFKEAINKLGQEDVRDQHDVLTQRILTAEEKLHAYKAAFQATVDRGRCLEKDGWIEVMIPAFEANLAVLKEKVAGDRTNGHFNSGRSKPLRWRDPFRGLIDQLERDAILLVDQVFDNARAIHDHAKSESKNSLWVAGSLSVLSLLLMAGLQRFYYHWVFNPVRDLMQGVARVARGDFGHTIRVDSGDEMQDLAVAFNDMTGRLREMYRDLERQVNERSRQLVRSERLASVGFLAAGVAHEINNPLASIAFCSEALEARLDGLIRPPARTVPFREAPGADAEVVFKYLKMIQQEAFRCKEITQRLLEFSRSSERRREPTDLGELVQAVLDVTQHLPDHKGKNILFDAPAQVTAWVNAQEIKSVVLNLVVNALESMDDDGSLTVSLRARDGMAEVKFRDGGCGMNAEVLENIFEPFYTQSRTGKGTGLGLTISHRVVTGHGGDIEAASAGPGLGSTFTVRLPLRPAGDATSSTEHEEVGSPEDLFRRRSAA